VKHTISSVLAEISNSIQMDCHIPGIPSGLLGIDFYTRGFRKGDVYVFSGEPNSYKTSLMLTILYNASVLFKYTTVYFTMDSSAENLVTRILFQVSNTNIQHFPHEKPTLAVLKNMYTAGEKIRRSNLSVVSDSFLSLEKIRNYCRDNNKISLIIVDYIQLLCALQKSALQELKKIAVEYNISVLVVNEIENETMLNKTLLMQGNCDAIFLLKNDVWHDKHEDGNFGVTTYVEMDILKQKNGPSCKKVQLEFEEHSLRFYSNNCEIFDDENNYGYEVHTC